MLQWKRLICALTVVVSCSAPSLAENAGRTKVRMLYDFEDASDVTKLMKFAENATLTIVEDVGVTHGRKCAA